MNAHVTPFNSESWNRCEAALFNKALHPTADNVPVRIRASLSAVDELYVRGRYQIPKRSFPTMNAKVTESPPRAERFPVVGSELFLMATRGCPALGRVSVDGGLGRRHRIGIPREAAISRGIRGRIRCARDRAGQEVSRTVGRSRHSTRPRTSRRIQRRATSFFEFGLPFPPWMA